MATRRPGLIGTCWPTVEEEAVLRGAALAPEAAARAWRGTRASIDLAALTGAELHRLLPALYANLRTTGTDDPDLPLLKGLYRRALYANRMLVHRVVPAITALHETGIEPVALKGLPVALLHAGDLAVRPMGDVDVVVTPTDASRAVAVLEAQGWRRNPDDPVRPDRMFRWRSGINLTGPEPHGGQLDLHWRLRRSASPPGEMLLDDLATAATVPLALPDGPTMRALGPADLLLHVIEHGVRHGSDAHVRWAWDAAVILRSAGDALDWRHLVRTARARRSTLQVRAALTYLGDTLDVVVPPAAIDDLGAVPPGRRERTVFRVVSGARPAISPWRLWSATSAGWSTPQAVRGFPGFLRDSWGLRSVAQVPFVAAARALRKVGRPRAVVARPGA